MTVKVEIDGKTFKVSVAKAQEICRSIHEQLYIQGKRNDDKQ